MSGKKIQEGVLEQGGVAQANTEVVRKFSMCNKPGTAWVWQEKKGKDTISSTRNCKNSWPTKGGGKIQSHIHKVIWNCRQLNSCIVMNCWSRNKQVMQETTRKAMCSKVNPDFSRKHGSLEKYCSKRKAGNKHIHKNFYG